MKQLLFFTILLVSPAWLSSKENFYLEMDRNRFKVWKLCHFLVEDNFVDQNHPCHKAIENGNESIIDELLERGILGHIYSISNRDCTIPPTEMDNIQP